MKRERVDFQHTAYNYRPPPVQQPPPKLRHEPSGSRRRRGLIGFLVVVLLLGSGLGVYALIGRSENPPNASNQAVPADTTPKPTAVKGRYLFSGTIVLDRVVASEARGDYNQPFSSLSTLGDFDTMVADLECPVTDSSYSAVKGQEQPRFNCQPAWLPTLKKYFGVIKLAGNHTYDMGADGFSETVERLQKAGIQTVGHHNPHTEKDNCEVVALPVNIKKTDGKVEKGNLPVAFCAFNYKIIFAPEAGEIETIQKDAEIMPVFGLLQAGAEYIPTASTQQQSYARRMIDNGAEFVIANGTHYVQNSEAYKRKLIVYSLGNFIFDQVDYETMRGLSIAVDMSVDYDQNVGKWLALSESCNITARKDNCLAAAQKQGLTKINLKLRYEPIGSSGGVYQITKRADDTLQKAIETRLDWAQTVKGLDQ